MILLNAQHFLTTLLCALPLLSLGQDTYEGQVIDKQTELVLSGVTVTLLKEKVYARTNEQGYYSLTSEKLIPNDTLQFTFVGYKSSKLPISIYQKQMFVVLEPSSLQLKEVEITNTKSKTITLGRFFYSDLKTVNSKAYTHITVPFFAQSAVAKHFIAPQAHARIKSIQIGRRDLDVGWQPHSTANKYTRFLMSIMSASNNSESPGEVIFTKTISLTDNSLLIKIDLSDEGIVLPTTNFFISIHWLIIPYNEIVNVAYDSKLERVTRKGRELYSDVSKYSIYYQPFLVGYESSKPARRFVHYNDAWRRGTAYPKHEIALSATLSY